MELRVRTPEGVLFTFPLASPITRFLAWAVDLIVVSATTGLLATSLSLLGYFSPDLSAALYFLGYLTLTVGYGIALEWFWRGQTLGKRLLGLRVMDARGLRLRFDQVCLRNLLRAVDSLPALYLVGGTVSLFSRRAQRLGDLAGNTVVIRSVSLPAPDLQGLSENRYNSLRAHPVLEARLRQRVPPAAAEILLQALLRREGFSAPGRVALFRELAAWCREVVPFPSEGTEGLSDEQYVRNVVEVLYQSHPSARM